jgi:hypothetical protein
MINLKQLEKQELDISSQVQERLEIRLDLLERIQEAIMYGIDLIMNSSQRINLENPKDRFQLFSIVCASRVIALARSSIQLCCKGYALEAAVLARSLFEVSVAYEYLANNPTTADLFYEDKISTTDVVKQAIRQNKKLTSDDDSGILYGTLSEFSHHSQWALSHAIDWEEGDKTFTTVRILIDDPERIDPPLRQVGRWMLWFYERFYKFVGAEFQIDESWQEQHSFIQEFQDILQ